jgi:hypothetical protein
MRVLFSKLLWAQTCAVVAGFVLTSLACDSGDRFDSAKTLKAPPRSSAPATADRPVKGRALPSGHPPIGQEVGQVPIARPKAYGAAASPPKPYGDGGLHWEAPESWKSVPPSSSMRKAEYVISGEPGQEPAVLAVFHFAGSGGSVEANISRWVGQFRTQDGAPAEAGRVQFGAGKLTVHRVDVAGTYAPGMSGGGGSKTDQRMLAGIVETASGPYFFKMIGPAALVAKEVDTFDAFLKGVRLATSK